MTVAPHRAGAGAPPISRTAMTTAPAPIGVPAQPRPTATSSQRKVLVLVSIGIAVVIVLMALGTLAKGGSTSSQSDFTSSDLVKVGNAAFPGWTVTPSEARPITETQVSAIAFATDPQQVHGLSGIYIYDTRAGIDASGEGDTRDFWRSNAETTYGVPYTWLKCRNAMLLQPADIAGATATNLNALGC